MVKQITKELMACSYCNGDGSIFGGALMSPNPWDYGDYEEYWFQCEQCDGRGWRWREILAPHRACRRLLWKIKIKYIYGREDHELHIS